MYESGPGVRTKKHSVLLVSSGLSGEGQCVVRSGENHTTLFILPWGKDPLNHLSLGSAVPRRMGGCTPRLPPALPRGMLWHCTALTCLMMLWLVRSPARTPPRGGGTALEALIRLLLCRRVSESLWMEICSSLGLRAPCIWSFLRWLQTKGKSRRAQEGFIHRRNRVLKENSPLVLGMGT